MTSIEDLRNYCREDLGVYSSVVSLRLVLSLRITGINIMLLEIWHLFLLGCFLFPFKMLKNTIRINILSVASSGTESIFLPWFLFL